jgi:Zn finger protein HypA/HybF involved in hydrogenase expression
MKDEIIIPVLKQEDFVAANLRRDKYSLTRDVQAQEFNGAIASRLLAQEKNQIRCDKCGKTFNAGENAAGLVQCPECR